MPIPIMAMDQFQDLLDRYGEMVETWPDQLRIQAQALLTQSEAARKLLSEASALRAGVAETASSAPAGLVDRIVAKALGSDKPQ